MSGRPNQRQVTVPFPGQPSTTRYFAVKSRETRFCSVNYLITTKGRLCPAILKTSLDQNIPKLVKSILFALVRKKHGDREACRTQWAIFSLMQQDLMKDHDTTGIDRFKCFSGELKTGLGVPIVKNVGK